MAQIIDGKAVAAQVRAQAAQEAAELTTQGTQPGLAVVIVGDDPASRIYVNNKKKACAEVGVYSEEHALPAGTSQDALLALIRQLNQDPKIHGFWSSLRCRRAWTRRAWWRPLRRKRM